MEDMESEKVSVTELPTVRIAITEPIPMMMPSIVRRARILFAIIEAIAIAMFSPSSNFSRPLSLAYDKTVMKSHDPLCFLCKLR